MEIKIVKGKISEKELIELAGAWYGDMIKGVVDLEREILALGGEYHMDANNVLVENGSKQDAVWGFNIHLSMPREDWIEFISLINIRPAQNNRGMLIESADIREEIRLIIGKRII